MESMSIKKAAMINMVAKYSNVIIGLIFSALIARILSPKDYGIVAIVTVFTTFFTIFTDMGIGSAIVQNKTLTTKDENSIFMFSAALGLTLAVFFSILGFPIALLYHNNVYRKIFPLLSLSLLFNTLNMVPNAKLMKAKKFLRVGIRTVVVTVVTYVVTIILALNGFKYYSLIIQSVLASIIQFFWNYYGSHLKFEKISRESIGKIKGFFAFQFAFDIMNYFARNLDNLLLGRYLGEKKLGYYDKGYRLMLYPINNLTFAITPVLHPILSDHQDNKGYIYEQYVKILKILSLMGVYISVFCFFSSKEIILIMFGKQWGPAIKCFQYLSVSVWAQMVTTTASSIYKSLGRTDLMFKSGLIHIPLSVALIIGGVFTKDIYIVAALVSFGLVVKFFIEYYFLIGKGFGKSTVRFYKNFSWEVGFCIVLSGAFILMKFVKIDNIVVSFTFKLLVSGILYLVLLLGSGQLKYFFAIMPSKVKNILKIK
ncbi:MAG: lipopolysaccharide biosynthesis protein [Eubacterium sp.]|nr:lipopolysaccharide biosynthesis protein [Eubacterium sp.]